MEIKTEAAKGWSGDDLRLLIKLVKEYKIDFNTIA